MICCCLIRSTVSITAFKDKSALAFGVTAEQSIVARTRHYVGSMRHRDDLRDETLQPTWLSSTGQERYKKVYITGGPERLRLNKHQAYYSPYLVFHGVGDIARIERLVQFHCQRIGVNANSGSGTVKQMAIKEIDQDFSFIDAHGQVARNLPCSFLQAVQGGFSGASGVKGEFALDWEVKTWSDDLEDPITLGRVKVGLLDFEIIPENGLSTLQDALDKAQAAFADPGKYGLDFSAFNLVKTVALS